MLVWNPLNPKNVISSVIWLTCLLSMSPAQAQVPAYYYQGRHRVQVNVQTDALALETTAPLSATLRGVSAADPAAKVQTTSDRNEKLTVHIKAQNLAELTGHAQRLHKSMPNVKAQAILAAPETSTTAPVKFLTSQISFRLSVGRPAAPLAARYGLTDLRPVPYSANTFIATVDTTTDILAGFNTANAMQESGDAEWAAPLIEEQKRPRAAYDDPMLPSQWHLMNIGSNTVQGTAGHDLKAVSAWDLATGDGVNIAISDEGVQTSHPDLTENVRMDLDYDINDDDDDPTPSPNQAHGVACAGVAAARGNNSIGVSGVAPRAGIVGLRLLATAIGDSDEATAMAWKASEIIPQNQVSINSNSWGPNDTGSVLQGPGPLTEAALEYGTTTGRNGKGIVYAWAAGNGRTANDNINKDGYANSPFVIAVGASNSAGTYSYYSEPGAALLINAPSGHYSDGIVTTDITGTAGSSTTDYRTNFSGTSSATPVVAGVVALMLQVNPSLTYRDVMHILVDTATINDPASPGWKTNGSGRKFSHDYGFGRVNALDAVTTTAQWENVEAPATIIEVSAALPVPLSIPDNNVSGVTVSIPVMSIPGFVIEHVELESNITHTYRGDLKIQLQSPSAMLSDLVLKSSDAGDNYDHWRFRSVAHWGEEPGGDWQVKISDLAAGDIGVVSSLTLRIRGYIMNTSAIAAWTLY